MSTDLKISLWSANGLSSRKLEFDQFLHQENINIAFVTETHCNEKFYILNMQTLNVYHTFYPSGKARSGAALYIKNSLPHLLSPKLTNSKIQMISITFPSSSRPITYAAVYCSSNCKLDSADLNLFFTQLDDSWLLGGNFKAKHIAGAHQKKQYTKKHCSNYTPPPASSIFLYQKDFLKLQLIL